MTSSDFDGSTEDPPARPDAQFIAVAIGATVAAALVIFRVATLNLPSFQEVSLVALAIAAAFAATAAAGGRASRWMQDRTATVAWLLPRVVLMAFAVFAILAMSGIAATKGPPPGAGTICPDSYQSVEDNGIRGGELLHASMRGDTFVCTYDDLTGSL